MDKYTDEPWANLGDFRTNSELSIDNRQRVSNQGWSPTPSALQLQAIREREVYGDEGKEAFLKRSTDSLIKQAFSSTMAERRAQEEGNSLDSLYRATLDASKRVSGINPAKSIELLEKAQALKYKNLEFNIKNNEIKQAQAESAGDIAFSIEDQESLDNALPELAKHGLVVPERFREWNAETKDWFMTKALKSKSVKETIKLRNEEAKIKLQEDKFQEETKAKLVKEKELAAKNEREKNEYKIKAKQTTTKNEDAMIESKALSEMNSDFDDLPTPIKIIASKDVYSIANKILVDGEAEDFATAVSMARTQVLSSISGGKYTGAKGGAVAKPTGAPASKFVEGKVYTDKYGNKAKYSNGNWIPQ